MASQRLGGLAFFCGIVGFIGGFCVALAVKCNLVAGFVEKTENKLILFALLGIVAGFSERLVPTLVGRIESSMIPAKKETT